MKKLSLGLAVFLFAVITITAFVLGGRNNNNEPVMWNIFSGEIPGYIVKIDELEYGNGRVSRIVHLYLIETLEIGCIWGCGTIMGHDYDGTFTGTNDWDRVFRCSYPDSSNGCNSVSFLDESEGVWEPSLIDEDDVGLEAVFRLALPETEYLLTEAMVEVYNEKHLVSTLEDWRARHESTGSKS